MWIAATLIYLTLLILALLFLAGARIFEERAEAVHRSRWSHLSQPEPETEGELANVVSLRPRQPRLGVPFPIQFAGPPQPEAGMQTLPTERRRHAIRAGGRQT